MIRRGVRPSPDPGKSLCGRPSNAPTLPLPALLARQFTTRRFFFARGEYRTAKHPRHPRECQFATFAKKEATPSRGLAPSPAANPMERLRLIDMSKPLHKGSPKERALRKKVKRCGTSELLTYLNLDGNWDIRLFALARLAKMKVDFKDNSVAFAVSRILFSMRNLSDSGNKFPHRDDIFFGRSLWRFWAVMLLCKVDAAMLVCVHERDLEVVFEEVGDESLRGFLLWRRLQRGLAVFWLQRAWRAAIARRFFAAKALQRFWRETIARRFFFAALHLQCAWRAKIARRSSPAP